MEIKSQNERQTEKFGYDLSRHLMEGDVVLLHGTLGAGKTCLVRGFVGSLLAAEDNLVKSPTYTFLNIYDTVPKVYHFDFLRLDNADDVESLGLNEYWGRGISFVEWPQKGFAFLSGRIIDVIFNITGDKERTIKALIPDGR